MESKITEVENKKTEEKIEKSSMFKSLLSTSTSKDKKKEIEKTDFDSVLNRKIQELNNTDNEIVNLKKDTLLEIMDGNRIGNLIISQGIIYSTSIEEINNTNIFVPKMTLIVLLLEDKKQYIVKGKEGWWVNINTVIGFSQQVSEIELYPSSKPLLSESDLLEEEKLSEE